MLSVLFVSHDDDLRAVAARVLQKTGCRVSVAAHAGHASLACLFQPAFDVVVVENRMPEGSGLAIAERLRRYCPDLAVVRMCGAPSEAPGEGVAIVRPFTADDLIDAVVEANVEAQIRRGATIL
jgi:CheY-like chemotaxis protein